MTNRYLTVDVLDSGALQGSGPLINVITAQVVQELDKAGAIAVTVPATDARAIALLENEVELQIKTTAGTAGIGILQNLNIVPGDAPVFQLSGMDLLGELNYLNTGYNRLYDNVATASAIIGTDATATSLLGGTGWTQGSVSIDADATPHTVTFNGATRLAALIQLAKGIGHHFRQGSTARTLDFGVFGADSGIRVLNVYNAGLQLPRGTDQAYTGTVNAVTMSADIENTLFPLGKDGFDLRDAVTTNGVAGTPITDILVRESQGPRGYATTVDAASSGPTLPVTATTGFVVGEEIFVGDADDWTQDHETGIIESITAATSITLTADLIKSYTGGEDVLQRPQFYVEDAASIAAYGVRESYPQFTWIGAGDTAELAAAQIQFAGELYLTAKAHLLRYKLPYLAYEVGDVYELPLDLQVGEKIRLRYQGSTSPYSGTSYLNINDDFYVMKITRTFDRSAGALGKCKLQVANVTRPMPNNASILVFNITANRWIGI